MTFISCRLVCFHKVTKCYLFPSTALICLRHTGCLLHTVRDPLVSPRSLTQLPLSPRWVCVSCSLVLFPYTAKCLWQTWFIFAPNDYLFSVPFSCLSLSITVLYGLHICLILSPFGTRIISCLRQHFSAHTLVEYSIAVEDSEWKWFIFCCCITAFNRDNKTVRGCL